MRIRAYEPLREFRYCWLHTKSENTGGRVIHCEDRWEFLEKLAQWNRESAMYCDGVFIYWEAD